MKKCKKKCTGNGIIRAILVAVSVLNQIGWLLFLMLRLSEYSTWLSLLTSILSIIVVLRLYSKHTTADMKMPWVMLILVLPVMGLSLYLLLEVFGDLGKTGKRLKTVREEIVAHLDQKDDVFSRLEQQDVSAANCCRYLLHHAQSPVYENTKAIYYGRATDAFEAMKEELEKAENFIFMEYFIVRDDSSFREIRQILERKAGQGVDVRLMYDDVGSIGYVSFQFARDLNRRGIRCQVFNPALPILNLFMNHRDHRKITVIDGKVGFTGGYNLADEYFDRKQPYGQWKDTGLKLEGEAVRSLTASFLEMWNTASGKQEDCRPYLDACHSVAAQGYVQPFGDNPLDGERVAENVYLNLIARAKRSLYVTTPYLIITDEMRSALTLAAKRGVDVRLIVPGIPDKKTVYAVTKSYFSGLARQGVRIYTYTPGFIHAKMCLCDGDLATVGTSNLDYRSLYLHFENNVLLYDCDAVRSVAGDFEAMFCRCAEVTDEYRAGRNSILRIWQCLLRLFAPLM